MRRNAIIRIAAAVTSVLAVSSQSNAATVLFTNLSYTTGGTEAAAGTNYLTSAFTTDTSTYTALSAVLLLDNPTAGSAVLSLYADLSTTNTSGGGLQPGTLLYNFSSPSVYNTSTPTATTFTLSGASLAASTTYWLVLKATTGEYDWGWTSSNSSTDSWGTSNDSGATWFTDDAFQLQFSLTASTSLLSTAWNSSSGGSWGTAANWTAGIPEGAGVTATLGTALTASGTVTLDAAHTVGHLVFNNSTASYNLSAGTSGTLTINNSANNSTGSPDITVLAGSHLISAPVVLAAGVNVATSTSTTLSIAGIISGTGPLTTTGAGTLKLSAADTYTGGTTVTGGTLELTSTGSLLSTGAINVSGGSLVLDASTGTGIQNRSIGALTVANGGVVHLTKAAAHTNRMLLTTTGLTISGTTLAFTGQMDLANNDLDVKDGSLSVITQHVASGFNASGGGTWNGSGIASTAAAADSSHLTALGVIQNNQSGSAIYTSSNTFDGSTPSASDLLVKYTYVGDANLDGKVDGSDYSLIDYGYLAGLSAGSSATGWYYGDFNYDGVIDGSDYTLIDNAFNSQSSNLSTSAIIAASTAQIASATDSSAVPEPASLGLIGLIGGGCLGRRRRLTHKQNIN